MLVVDSDLVGERVCRWMVWLVGWRFNDDTPFFYSLSTLFEEEESTYMRDYIG